MKSEIKTDPKKQTKPVAEEALRYPEKIPEAQGDLADRANAEIDQEIQEGILRARVNTQNATR